MLWTGITRSVFAVGGEPTSDASNTRYRSGTRRFSRDRKPHDSSAVESAKCQHQIFLKEYSAAKCIFPIEMEHSQENMDQLLFDRR